MIPPPTAPRTVPVRPAHDLAEQEMVNVYLNDGVPTMDFTVWVVVDGNGRDADLGVLSTDRKGKGNAHLALLIADQDDGVGDAADVRVVVDNCRTGSAGPCRASAPKIWVLTQVLLQMGWRRCGTDPFPAAVQAETGWGGACSSTRPSG